jgi:hypothetical protein
MRALAASVLLVAGIPLVAGMLLTGCLAAPDVSHSLFHCSADHRACPDGFVCNTGRDRDTCQRPCDPAAASCPTGLACLDYGDSEPVFLCGPPSDATP